MNRLLPNDPACEMDESIANLADKAAIFLEQIEFFRDLPTTLGNIKKRLTSSLEDSYAQIVSLLHCEAFDQIYDIKSGIRHTTLKQKHSLERVLTLTEAALQNINIKSYQECNTEYMEIIKEMYSSWRNKDRLAFCKSKQRLGRFSKSKEAEMYHALRIRAQQNYNNTDFDADQIDSLVVCLEDEPDGFSIEERELEVRDIWSRMLQLYTKVYDNIQEISSSGAVDSLECNTEDSNDNLPQNIFYLASLANRAKKPIYFDFLSKRQKKVVRTFAMTEDIVSVHDCIQLMQSIKPIAMESLRFSTKKQ